MTQMNVEVTVPGGDLENKDSHLIPIHDITQSPPAAAAFEPRAVHCHNPPNSTTQPASEEVAFEPHSDAADNHIPLTDTNTSYTRPQTDDLPALPEPLPLANLMLDVGHSETIQNCEKVSDAS